MGFRSRKIFFGFNLVAIAVVTVAILLIARDLTSTHQIIDETLEGATFHIEISPAYVVVPGQYINLNWRIEGIQDVFVNGDGKIGNFSETRQLADCHTINWSGSSLDDLDYMYTATINYVYRHPAIQLGSAIILVTLILLNIANRIPDLATKRDHPIWTILLFKLVLTFTGIGILLVSWLNIPCREDPFFLEQHKILLNILVSISVMSFLASAVASRTIRDFARVVIQYLFTIAILHVIHIWDTPDLILYLPIPNLRAILILIQSSIYIILILFFSLLLYQRLARHINQVLVALLISVIVVCNVAINSASLTLVPAPKTNQLRDIYHTPALIDIYEFTSEHYDSPDIWINLSPDYNPNIITRLRFEIMTPNRLVDMQDRPDLFLTDEEITILRDLPYKEVTVEGLDFFLLETSPDMEAPLLLTHFDDDKLFMIPFDNIPERIKANWAIK